MKKKLPAAADTPAPKGLVTEQQNEHTTLLEKVRDNIFPAELLGPKVADLIYEAKAEICADKRYKNLVKSGYTPEDIVKAAIAYSITGSVSKAASVVGIPDTLIRAWKFRPWWAACLRVARHYNTVETDISVRRIRDTALQLLAERLQNPGSFQNKDLLQALRVTDTLTVNNDKRLGLGPEDEKGQVMDSLEQIKNHMREMSTLYRAKDITDLTTVTVVPNTSPEG